MRVLDPQRMCVCGQPHSLFHWHYKPDLWHLIDSRMKFKDPPRPMVQCLWCGQEMKKSRGKYHRPCLSMHLNSLVWRNSLGRK